MKGQLIIFTRSLFNIALRPALLLVITATSFASVPRAQAQTAEAVAQKAKAITVRIEGATQGSGILVKREGNTYTVLTAWHVLDANKGSEEVVLITPDGNSHTSTASLQTRIASVDLGTITFSSPRSYQLAVVGNPQDINAGSRVYVSGFPLATSAVPQRIIRFLSGDVVANATSYIPDGYQLIYTNPTLPGMSGGPVVNSSGLLVGVHGRGETDTKLTMQSGLAVKTGNNLAIPISYFSASINSAQPRIIVKKPDLKTAGDYLAMAQKVIKQQNPDFEKLRRYSELSIQSKPSFVGYYYLAVAHKFLGNERLAQLQIVRGMRLPARTASDFYYRGLLKGTYQGTVEDAKDLKQAYVLNPGNTQYLRSFLSANSVLNPIESAIFAMQELSSRGTGFDRNSWISLCVTGKLALERYDSKRPRDSRYNSSISPDDIASLRASYSNQCKHVLS